MRLFLCALSTSNADDTGRRHITTTTGHCLTQRTAMLEMGFRTHLREARVITCNPLRPNAVYDTGLRPNAAAKKLIRPTTGEQFLEYSCEKTLIRRRNTAASPLQTMDQKNSVRPMPHIRTLL